MKYIYVITLLFISTTALADDVSDSFFTSTYNFNPHELNEEEIKTRSSTLDILWKKVQDNPDRYINSLRSSLKSNKFPPFFYYDGGQLLLKISNTQEDKELALSALSKVDLKDIQPTYYLRTVHSFSVESFDTTDAATHILAYDNFQAFIPQHVLSLGQDFSLLFMLMPLKEEIYVKKLISLLKTQKSEVASKSIILVLWYSVTREGNKALKDYSKDKGKPEELRNYANELMSRNKKVAASSSSSSIDTLRKERREAMGRISDEALHELNALTRQIIAKLN